MSDNNNNVDDTTVSDHDVDNNDDVDKYFSNEVNTDDLFNCNYSLRAQSFSFGIKNHKNVQAFLNRSRTVCSRNSEDIRRLILPVSLVHRNYCEWKEDENLIMNATENSFSFYYNEEKASQNDELPFYDQNLHSIFHYNLMERIAFYKSHHGAFNKNPNESLGEDIMHLSKNRVEPKNTEEKKKNEKSFDSRGPISKILNIFFKTKKKSSESICSNQENEDEIFIDSSNDADDSQAECYMAIDYKISLHKRSESYHFRTRMSHMKKIHKFIETRFPRHIRVKSSTIFVELPRLDQRAMILTKKIMSDLFHFVPCMHRSREVHIVYSTYIHGHSLRTMYRNCQKLNEGYFLLLIKESTGTVFGAMLSHAPEFSHTRYYGDPSCVVYRCDDIKGTIVYRWSKIMDYFIHCDPDFMIIGGCQGSGAALFLDDNLLHGRSTKSDTFMSETLSDEEDFIIVGMELWIFGENILSDSARLVSFYPAN